MSANVDQTPGQQLITRLNAMNGDDARRAAVPFLAVVQAAAAYQEAARAFGLWEVDDEAPLNLGADLERAVLDTARRLDEALNQLGDWLGEQGGRNQ
jgi:hypothetical protein